MILPDSSLAKLQGVQGPLKALVLHAADDPPVPFIVTEGLRSIERQRQLVKAGASQTMRSRHLTGHAVDIAAKVGGKLAWDWPLYERLAVHFKQVARELGTPLEWGGDWTTFRDGPHYQLPWREYPA